MHAPQAPTFDEFDFLGYGEFRFDTFFRTKKLYEVENLSRLHTPLPLLTCNQENNAYNYNGSDVELAAAK